MAKTSSKKTSPGSKSKGKAAASKTAGKSAKPVVSSKPAAKKVPAAGKKPTVAAPVKKRAPVVVTKAAPAKAVAKAVATPPVTSKTAPVAPAAAKGKSASKSAMTAKAIMAARPAPIMLVPRVPSATGANGKPVAAVKPSKKSKKHRAAEKRPVAEPAYRPPVQESVPTDGKPRKNQAGLLSKELEHFRDLLLEKRREIVGDMSSMEREALRAGAGGLSSLPVHMADMGTDNYEQEFTLGLVEKDRNLLREINAALAKVQNGTYGLCEGTGKPINKVRLEAQPWARFSIEWAREMERNRGIR